MSTVRPALTPDVWRRAQAAFHAAAEQPPTARGAVLDAACADDPALRAVVERMLAADAGASLQLGIPTPATIDDADRDGPSIAGRRVGPYQIVRELGRGGMGTVYLAEREDVGREVALKLVRGGLAAPDRVDRFLLERRVLARLDHPHVARLLDAGVADDGTPEAGTPWFAMEYVDGLPLDRYCDAHRLGVAERLRLVEQVCEAVAYAHRNLVVHRDLKPGNLLVTGAGEVKLLDFGIAKLLEAGEEAAGRAGLTEAGVRLLTPEYAAPEQLRGEPVTTATDVYALGVVLHELLTGRRPATPLRPTRPSAVVRAPDADAIAAARGATPERLRRALAGDLDTVVLRALDPDPERRYATAAELLDDLQRHRTGFPVRARPDGGAYQARLFVRRNRWGVAAVAGAFTLLAGTAVVTALQEARTRRALAHATAEAAKARQVTRFVTSLLQDADPYRTGTTSRAGGAVTLGELLDAGTARIDQELAAQPTVRAELLHTIGAVQRSLGRYAQADTLLRRAVAERQAALGADAVPDADLASLLADYGTVRRALGDVRGADTLVARAVAMYDVLPGSAPEAIGAARYTLGVTRLQLGHEADAERLFRQALALQTRVPGQAAATLGQLAHVRARAGDYVASDALRRAAIALLERQLGPEHPAVARAYMIWSGGLLDAGQLADAERTARQALAIQRRRLPAGHPDALATESHLAIVLMQRGALAPAERMAREVLDARRRLLGDTSRDVAGSLAVLGDVRLQRGDTADAVRILARSLATYERVSGPADPDGRGVLQRLTDVADRRGREAGTPPRDPDVLFTLAAVLGAHGECGRAVPLFRRAVLAHRARGIRAGGADSAATPVPRALAVCAPRPAPRQNAREEPR